MKSKILLFLSLLFINYTYSQNLLTNGDFESGSSGTGFVTSGAGYTQLVAPFSGTTVTGNFAVVDNPYKINTANFIFEGDHTNGSTGKMLAIDGNTTAGNPRFWQAGNTGTGVTGLTNGATYRFSYWIKSVSNLGSPANISLQITGGTPPVLTSGTALAPAPALGWRQVIYTFVATATTVQIELWNTNTAAAGNDFAVDDLMLTDDLMVSANVTNAACATAADGSITVTGFGGTPPYVNYTIAGPVNQNNATGIFPNLPPGVYTVTVTDSALPTAATATLTNVVVGPHITVTNATTILCGGTPVTLMASGSPSGYTWTAVPADPTLTTPNVASPTVSPAGTTVYTVSSTVGSCAPITNTVTVTVTNPQPTATITNGTCAGTAVTANPSPAGTYSYVWTVPAGQANPGNVATFNPTVSGNYTVVVTNTTTTCSSAPVIKNITFTPRPTGTITNTPACATTPVTPTTITANPNPAAGTYSYAWTVPAPEPNPGDVASFNATTGGAYSVIITDTATGCASATITKNITFAALPVVTSPSTVQTICPGNTASITIVGTPNSNVTLTYPSLTVPGATTTQIIAIGPSGTSLPWVTPPLNATVVFTVVKIKGFFTLCENILTGPTFTVNVVPNGCATVATQPASGTPPLDLTLCTTGECRTLQANFSNVPSTNSYSVSSIPYCPQAAFTDPSYNQVSATGDDIWSAPITLPFNFCFFNQNYTTCQVGTNGLITFNPQTFPGFCDWQMNGINLPSTAFTHKNAIFGALQDTETRTAGGQAPPEVSVNWKLIGTYPCRKLIVNFYHLGQFQCNQNVGLQTSQIVLYEVSNIIEVYIQNRTRCTSWESGEGVIGIINNSGTQGYTPPNRNVNDAWTASNEAWRFTPTGPNVPVTIDWFQGTPATGTHIGAGPTVTVCPAATTTYTLQATYQVCGVPQTAVTTTTLNVHPDATGAPGNLTKCAPACNFDLTQNDAVILGALPPADYDISYHTSQADADIAANPIATPNNYCPNAGAVGTYTVYASIYLNSYNCHIVKPFTLTIQNCGVTPDPVPDLIVCDDPSNDGSATFNLNPQIPIALGANNPADYTITFHTSLADANSGANPISPTNAYTSVPRTVWIRMESNINAGQYGVTDFDLIINVFANAGTDGNTTVCETSTTPIDLFGLIGGEQTGGTWTQTSGTGGTFNAAAGTFTPAVGATTSTFTYTVHGVAPCVDDTSVATVNINPQPTAGTDGGIVICASSSTPIDLYSLITGEQAGGTWTQTSGSGGTFNAAAGTFTPTAGATTSTFTYTVIGTAPCINDSSLATVTITGQPDAGVDGSTVVCETSTTAINLNSLITGEQAGGVWTQTSGTGGTFNAAAGTFTPAVGATTSTFTYTISGTAPCITDDSLATVTIIAQPTAGTDGGTVVCETSTTAVDLFSLITGEQAGGNWVRTTGTGGTFNAAAGTYTPAVGATSSTFTYTVTGTAPCINDSSVATITINAQPNAGTDGGTTVCETSTAVINLFNLITGEQAGGVWTQTSGTGGTFNAAAGTFTPAVGATTSTFTYTLTGTAPCINDTSLATVTINPQPNAGVDGGTIVCETLTTPVDLFSLITGEQPGGTWTQTSGTGGTFNAAAGTYTPAVGASATQTFTYTLTGTAPCINDSSLATITINPQPTAGTDGATAICQNSTAVINLFSLITGEQPGGTWTQTSGTGGTFNAAAGTFVSGAGATTSTFTYTVNGTAPCINDSSIATVTINPVPTATISGTTSVCVGAPLPDIIITGAGGTPQYTFNYTLNTAPLTATTGGGNSVNIPIPSTAAPATYIYNLVSVTDSSTTACSQNQTGTVTVTVVAPPTINTPTNYVVCDDSLNNDGVYCGFNLHTKDAEVTSSPTVTVTYHQTLTDAQTGGNPLTSPYCNNANPQTIYVRAFDASAPACYSTTSFQLIVNPIPLPNPVITDYELCDYNNPGDGVEVFDLGTKTAEIANFQPNVTVTYYATLADAQAQTSPLPNLYPNTSSPNQQQIWINIRNNTTGCNTTGTFNLIVNPLPTALTPPPLFQCSNGLVLTATFNLTVNQANTTGGVPGLTLTYYHNLADAQAPSNPIATPATYLGSDNEIIYIRVEDGKGCFSTTTQLLRVTQGPVAVTPSPLQYCDPNNDGFGEFNLNDATNQIAGGSVPPGVSVSYHETQTDASIGANPIPLSTLYNNITPWSQILFVRVYYTLTGCANYVQLKLNVNPTPEATTPTDYQLCDDNAPVGQENFNLTTKIPEILGSINPTTVTVTFYTSLTDAQTPSNAITSIASYPAGPNQTIYVRVEFIATGCYDIVPLNLIVNPLPNSMQPNYPQYSLCDNNQSPGDIGYEVFDLASQITTIQMGQPNMEVHFYISLVDAQSHNSANEITVLNYRNQVQYVQTLGIDIVNPTTGCHVISTMDIRVEPLPSLIPPTAPYTICDQDQDGYATFDLTTLLPGLLGTPPANYTVTFHETLTDAQNNGTSIPIPNAYNNIYAFTQTIYVRAEDNNTHCVSVIPIVLNVDPSPIAPVFLDDIEVCDQDSNTQNASTLVNLTQRDADVLAQQPLAAGNYTVTYYNTQALAQAGTAPIIPATAYNGTNGEVIWVRVENTTTHCYNIGSFNLIINIPLLLTTPTPLNVCDDDANPNDQHHSFDLTVKDPQINQGSGWPVTYYTSLALAQAGAPGTEISPATAYVNVPPAVQTLWAVVTSPAGCRSWITLDIRVLPIPTPNTNPPALAPKCDDNNPGDGVEYFDLTVNAAYIMNGDPLLTLHYFPTLADAEANNTAAELIPANHALVGGNVFIRVENNRVDYQGNHCFVIVEQPLTVNPLPTVIQPLPPYRMCDDDADGIAYFDLTDPVLAPQILGTTTTGQQPADYAISYYLTPADAAAGTSPLVSPYQNVTPTTQNIYIRVVNRATGCVNATGVLTLAVEQQALATGPQSFSDCDNYNDPYDGIHQVDLTQYESAILNGQNPAVFIVSYYTSQADAIAGTGALTLAQAQAYITDPDTDTVWVKVENSSNSITPLCYAITTIDINVERYPNPIVNTPNGVNTICVDFLTDVVIRPLTLDAGMANPANYTYEWFEAGDPTTVIGTNPTYTVDTSATGGGTRSYTVHVTSNTALACDTTSAPFDVIQSGPAVIPAGSIGYTVTDAFSASQVVTVTVTGYGTYEYSMDDGPRQASNVFENVSLGTHVIHVWDTEGGVAYSCEELIINEVQIIDYPHYFTPNGDGIHDTWNIVGLGGQPNAKIYIFDRYGKLMKQISSTGQGWDGTYNGHQLPSDDYWFTVDFIENSAAKQFKAHFSLKR